MVTCITMSRWWHVNFSTRGCPAVADGWRRPHHAQVSASDSKRGFPHASWCRGEGGGWGCFLVRAACHRGRVDEPGRGAWFSWGPPRGCPRFGSGAWTPAKHVGRHFNFSRTRDFGLRLYPNLQCYWLRHLLRKMNMKCNLIKFIESFGKWIWHVIITPITLYFFKKTFINLILIYKYYIFFFLHIFLSFILIKLFLYKRFKPINSLLKI